MLETFFNFVVGLIGGIAVGLQSPIAGTMSQRVGGAASSFIVHVSGALFSGLLLLLRGGENIRAWRSLPWYMLVSGAFGVILYLTLTHTLPRVGTTTAATLLIVGQLLIGVLTDHFGWFGLPLRPLDLTRGVALLLLLAGAWLLLR
ncbi:MAG: DMT family transporter [Chloroflexi bacterium]|nr:DMT family transporter [Chloroflexota bacterium]